MRYELTHRDRNRVERFFNRIKPGLRPAYSIRLRLRASESTP